MKAFRDILSVGTILPALLVGQPGYAAMPSGAAAPDRRGDLGASASDPSLEPMRIAQAAPTEEELRKRQHPQGAPGGQRPAAPQGQAPGQPRPAAPATAPVQQMQPQRPAAPPVQVQPPRPAAPTVAPVAPQRPAAPAAPVVQPQRTAPAPVAPPPVPGPASMGVKGGVVAPPPVAAPVTPPPQRTVPTAVPPAPVPAASPPKGGVTAPVAPTAPVPPTVSTPMQPKAGVTAPAVPPSMVPVPAGVAPKGGMGGAPAPTGVPVTAPTTAPTGVPVTAPAAGSTTVAPTTVAPGVAPTLRTAPPTVQPGVAAPLPGQPAMPPHGRPPMPPQGQPGPQSQSGGGLSPLGAAAVGVGVGVVGGMLLGTKPAQSFGEVQSQRREVREGDALIYSEPGRVIVRDGDGLRLRHDETERFRDLGGDIRTERRGDETVQIYDRPDGVRIITVTDPDGRLIRRIRQTPDGREVVLIDNGPYRPRDRWREERVRVAPPRFDMPNDVYIVDAGRADRRVLYEALEAPPVAPLERRYTLDEVRYNRDVRSYMRSVDVDTLTFESGSWTVDPSQYDRLATIAEAINRAIAANPREVYLVEGHTDAVGNDIDNLSLSDRRAQSVATILSRNFAVPAENLVTQGYGEQFLKVQTGDAARENRRVTVRRITPLIAGQNGN